ncbi:hypothetical protein IWW38_004115 [Coemansia aciculifera]|uniref:Uncharacterized protein n=1 Tax=Coemansia aciculifera TaxID=417176 RepID=A0ACC1LZA3_9FUNG|nr:hypothetical protein IWW38_004115 [Coemansia aciculifera]
MCAVAKPKPDFSELTNSDPRKLVVLPSISTADSRAFELDSDVHVYICRLAPCATVSHNAAGLVAAGHGGGGSAKKESPPIFEIPRVRRTATTLSTNQGAVKRRHPPGLRKDSRSIYLHVYSDFSKTGTAKQGGARLMLPGAIQLCCGDGIHLLGVAPGAVISIKNIGYDRAQFVLIDMPGYKKDDSDAASI